LQKIQDIGVAKQLLEKVNAYNIESIAQTFAITVVFAILPQTVTAPLAFFAILYAALYVAQQTNVMESLFQQVASSEQKGE